MNIIKIHGGLGNQMFQYALGKAQESNGIEVKYDLCWFDRSQHFSRPYRLDRFQVRIKTSLRRGLKRLKERNFDLGLLTYDNHYFDGYWQYVQYYGGVLPLLKKEFCVKEELLTKEYFELKERIVNSNSVSLHVRRGDLLINDRDYAQTIDYYNGALDCIKKLKKNCEVFVFSDDREWCKENFKNVTFVSLIDYLDLELMKLCKHNIITNSTFSWWASFLNENNSKIIIAPKMWRSDPKDQIQFEKGLYLKKWIIL